MNFGQALAAALASSAKLEEEGQREYTLALAAALLGNEFSTTIGGDTITVYHANKFGPDHPIVPELRALEAAATAKLEADLIALLQKHFGGEAFTALQIAEEHIQKLN